ncbi:MAG: VWA domain-containing protein [Burkholderiales bacterium]|nr:VWA domain-containing protein [Burkholderiales bacterium]
MSIDALWPLWFLTALPALWWLTWRDRRAHGRRRLWSACLLRSLAFALVIAALVRPAALCPVDEVSVVYALDLSHSVRARDIDAALRWIDTADAAHRPGQSRIVAFADGARLLDTTAAVRDLALADGDSADADTIDRTATDLEQALRTALHGFAPAHARRLVLISDGRQTQGDVWRAMPALRAAGVRVYTLPLDVGEPADAWIEAIDLPEHVRAREPTPVTVRVFARTPGRARVTLQQTGQPPLQREVDLVAGSNAMAFEPRFARTGESGLRARVAASGDSIADNDEMATGVWVERPVRALLVEGGAAAPYLADALRAQGIEVQAARADALAARLQEVDTVVLSDVAPERLDNQTAANLETFVRDAGGGLVFAAGENTYGKDGFAGSAIERVLPVTFEARRKKRELDLVLLIDRSHSMRGRKLELAKSAALGTLDLLQPEHRLGVVAFDAKPHPVVPLDAVGNKRRAEDLILSMTASGQTNVYNALLQARTMLAGSKAQTRHVILLSDGVTASAPLSERTSNSERAQETIRRVREEAMRREGQVIEPIESNQQPALEGFTAFAQELADEGITLSTVAIGEKPDLLLLETLAEAARGKHYVALSDAEIPGLFVAEARRLLGESIVETTFQAQRRAASALTAGVAFENSPPLHGYVAVRAKGVAEVLLNATQDKPLLVATQYGLGRTVAFMSDVKNRWAAQWLSWPGYGRLWAQVVRGVARPPFDALTWRVQRDQREAVITLVGQDAAGFRTALAPQVRVRTPDGGENTLLLRQTGAGEYRVRVPLALARWQQYRFEVLAGGGIDTRAAARLGTRTLYYAHADEFRSRAPDAALLAALSVQSGGRPGALPAEIFDPREDGGTRARPLWPWLLGAALLVYLIEIAVRRVPWPPFRRAG